MKFRDDINALRCLAVISVVLYHFGIHGFSGGFAGVDIFFVISGFLMTSILYPLRTEKNVYAALADFYLRRARRIFPALAVLCVTLLLFGYIWLTPSDYATMGSHVAASISFISNFIYKGEEGYFDGPTQDNWLLHTWSLSLEWQFYLLYPFLLLGLSRLDKKDNGKATLIGLSAIIIISLLLSIVLTPIKMSFSFYILPTRIWEFIAGGIVYFIMPAQPPSRMVSSAAEITGLSLILATIFLCDRNVPWPGYHAILPVLGTALIIAAAHQKSIWIRPLPVQKIGLWSYSIYLWHWPILRALRYFELEASPLWRIGGILVSLLAGALSFHLIELRLRTKSEHWSTKNKALATICMAIIISGGGMGIYFDNGIVSRVPQAVALADTPLPEEHSDHPCRFDARSNTLKDCLANPENKSPHFIIWGDSHAGVVMNAVKDMSRKHGILYMKSSCPTILDAYPRAKGSNSGCQDFNALVLQETSMLPEKVPVIIVNRWSYYTLGPDEDIKRLTGMIYTDGDTQGTDEEQFTRHLTATFCTVAKKHKTYAVLPIPEMPRDVPKSIARELMTTGIATDMFITRENYDRRQMIAISALTKASKTCGVTLLDPTPYLCTKGKCSGSIKAASLYKDDDHLNALGEKMISPLFQAIPELNGP